MCLSEPVRLSPTTPHDRIPPYAADLITSLPFSPREIALPRSRRDRRPHRIAALDGAQPAARRALATHFAALRAALRCVHSRAAACCVPCGARARPAARGARGGRVCVGEWAHVRDARRGGAACLGWRDRRRDEYRAGGRRWAG